MSIRKRLLLSNAVMVILPVIIIVLIILFLNMALGFNRPFWNPTNAEHAELVNSLKKMASLEQEKLTDSRTLDKLMQSEATVDLDLVITKQSQILYTTNQQIEREDLPPFGNESIGPYQWINHKQYSVRQHDFYFKDGDQGAFFILDYSNQFPTYARTFFPIVFMSLIVILILTNVLLSYFVSKSIVKPVHKLSHAARKISRGDLDFTLQSNKKDELGELTLVFDNMRAQLKESMEMRAKYEQNRKRLIANISHDLKTPITSILGYIEGLQVGVANTKEKQKKYLETVHTKANYLNRLIEELFLFSTLDLKKLPFHFKKVEINDFVKDYVTEIEDDLKDKNVLLTFDGTSLKRYVSIDPDKMVRVLQNIIYNSVKYLDKKQGLITISIKDTEKFVEVAIIDNGPGVSDQELNDIFNQFYQADPSRQSGGSGLGLAISSQIITEHNGRIWAENNKDGGLSVHFTLPKWVKKGDENE